MYQLVPQLHQSRPFIMSRTSSFSSTSSFAVSLNSIFSSSSSVSSSASSSPSITSSASTSAPSSSIFTTSFTQSTSSHLTFSSFPPTNVPKNFLDQISLQVAIGLLHDHRNYITLNPLVTKYHEIPQGYSAAGKLDPLKLLAEFSDPASLEKSSSASARSLSTKPSTGEWRYYSVTDILPLPVGLIKSETTYQVALRATEDGIESLVLAPNYFILYNTLRIESRGSNPNENISRETVWLVETAEVRCWRGLSWYVEKNMAESQKSLHERFRVRWDQEVLDALDRQREEKSRCAM
jgi:hypothetical protein